MPNHTNAAGSCFRRALPLLCAAAAGGGESSAISGRDDEEEGLAALGRPVVRVAGAAAFLGVSFCCAFGCCAFGCAFACLCCFLGGGAGRADGLMVVFVLFGAAWVG